MQPRRHEAAKKDTKKTVVVVVALFACASLSASWSSSAQQRPAREVEARVPIDAFFKAFNARDNDALKKTLHYPHVRINEAGGVNVWKDAAEAGTNFDALTRNEGWARSSLDSVAMRQNDAIKVHFDVVFSRYKADGTKYAAYQSLWIVTKKDDGWGVQARSSFAP
jgi:hypothetical protein